MMASKRLFAGNTIGAGTKASTSVDSQSVSPSKKRKKRVLPSSFCMQTDMGTDTTLFEWAPLFVVRRQTCCVSNALSAIRQSVGRG
jgi:hypothetical protein